MSVVLLMSDRISALIASSFSTIYRNILACWIYGRRLGMTYLSENLQTRNNCTDGRVDLKSVQLYSLIPCEWHITPATRSPVVPRMLRSAAPRPRRSSTVLRWRAISPPSLSCELRSRSSVPWSEILSSSKFGPMRNSGYWLDLVSTQLIIGWTMGLPRMIPSLT